MGIYVLGVAMAGRWNGNSNLHGGAGQFVEICSKIVECMSRWISPYYLMMSGLFIAMVATVLVVSSQPKPPVSIINVRTSINDGIWRIDATLVQHTDCEYRILDRQFLAGSKKWREPPHDTWVGGLTETHGPATPGIGTRPVWIEYKVRPGERGVYRVTQEAGGCNNGFEGEALSVEVSFDWTGIQH